MYWHNVNMFSHRLLISEVYLVMSPFHFQYCLLVLSLVFLDVLREVCQFISLPHGTQKNSFFFFFVLFLFYLCFLFPSFLLNLYLHTFYLNLCSGCHFTFQALLS